MANGRSSGQITIFSHGSEDGWRLPEEIKEELGRFKDVHILASGLPTANIFSDQIEVHSYEDILSDEDNAGRFEEIASLLLAESRGRDLLLLLSEGKAGKAEVCEAIFRAASQGHCRLRVMEATGWFGTLLLAARQSFDGDFTVAGAGRLASLHHPSFPPHITVIIPDLRDAMTAGKVKTTLMAMFPSSHPVRLVQPGKGSDVIVKDITLIELDPSSGQFHQTAMIAFPLESEQSFEGFQEIIAALRAPDGCPWDREQDHLTLRKNLLEETYEALSAMDNEDVDGMREELGDLLLQIVLHAQIASEAGEFRMGDILAGINRKLVHRHPHVFGEASFSGVKHVLVNWERLKEEERAARGEKEKGQLDGVPMNLPSLTQAYEIQSRAARVGFDWSEIEPVLDKVREEIDEVQSAQDCVEREKEIGDLLFAVVNLARWHKVDAESALRLTNMKFRKRFAYIEKEARGKGRRMADMSLAEMDLLWEEAKGLE